MWNFLVSGLTIGCTLVLYDGSPLRDVSLLWKLVDDLGITIFGTSAKYLDQLSVSSSLLSSAICLYRLHRNIIGRESTIAFALCGTFTPLDRLLHLLCLIMSMNISILACFWARSLVSLVLASLLYTLDEAHRWNGYLFFICRNVLCTAGLSRRDTM